MKKFTFNMPEELHRRLKVHCAETDQDMAAIVNRLVEDYLEKIEKKTKR